MADLIPMLAAVAGQAGEEADEDFNQTVLLLHGDGTNGAQNNTFLDGSTNNFTITRNGNTTQGTFSPFSVAEGEWSNYFDGTGGTDTNTDRLNVANNAAFNLGSGDFTMESFFYLTATPTTTCRILEKADAIGNDEFIFSIPSLTDIRFSYSTSGSGFTDITFSTTLAIGQWYHVALTRSGSTLTCYLNGASLGGQTLSATIRAGTASLAIGNSYVNTRAFPGYLSNVRLIKGSVVTPPSGGPTAPLTSVSGTSLLTCQSNRFVDNSTNAFAITRNGDVRVTPFSPFAPSAAYDPAVNGGSGYFDGSGDTLTAPDNAAFDVGSGDWTIECFANFSSVSGEKGLFSHFADVAGNTNGYTLRLSTGNSPSGLRLVCSSNNTNVILQAAWTPVVSAWYHIAAVRDGGTLRIYVDGVQIGSTSIAITIGNPATTFAIGTTQTVASSDMNGYISNVRMIKGTCLYTGGTTFTPPTAPLTAVSGTELLCNFTNAGIFDNTGKNNLETVGNAQIDTTTKKYGTGSMEFDGAGDWLLMANTPDQQLGTGNFTIEFWVYLATGDIGSARGLVAKGTSTTGWLVSLDSSEKVVFTFTTSTITSSGAITTNAWNHIAVVREGTGTDQTKIYIGGTNDGTGTVSTDFNQTSVMYVGCNRTAGDPMKGFIDDLRITKGVARYTANYSAPGKAFPDF